MMANVAFKTCHSIGQIALPRKTVVNLNEADGQRRRRHRWASRLSKISAILAGRAVMPTKIANQGLWVLEPAAVRHPHTMPRRKKHPCPEPDGQQLLRDKHKTFFFNCYKFSLLTDQSRALDSNSSCSFSKHKKSSKASFSGF